MRYTRSQVLGSKIYLKSNIDNFFLKQRIDDYLGFYKNHVKLVCNGIVIDTARNEKFYLGLLDIFKKTLEKAFSDTNWKFNDTTKGIDWLQEQSNRLGCPLLNKLEIVQPGTILPLCPYLQDFHVYSCTL